MLNLIFLLSIPLTVLAGDCIGKGNGVYEIGCRAYLTCRNGVATVINCGNSPDPNTTYNNRTKTCDKPSNVDPPCGVLQDCTGMADRRYADLFTHCKTYYTCQGETFFGHNICTPGLVFDESLQTCNWPRNVPPPCGTHITTQY